MPRSDPEFWTRRTNVATIWTNLCWTLAHVWAHGRGPALGIVAVQILTGLQPALLIEAEPLANKFAERRPHC